MGIENVIKKIHVEPINRKAEYEAAGFLTREEVTAAMDRVADQVLSLIHISEPTRH